MGVATRYSVEGKSVSSVSLKQKMPKGSTPVTVETPLYVRWGADRSPYAIELKLELVGRLRRELQVAAAAGTEIGGVLVGALPTAKSPTLRIEDVDLIARRADDGATFMLENGGNERFGEVRRRAQARERVAVGFFRSHLRTSPLRPAIADRTLLAEQFKDPVYTLLLVDGNEPFTASFFVASNGPLPSEMSVREFRFDEAEFRALPELESEYTGKAIAPNPAVRHSPIRTIALLGAIAFALLAIVWYFNQSLFPLFWTPTANSLQLTVAAEGRVLRISWNHGARDFDRASNATLTIHAGDEQRELRLGLDDLRLGAVELETTAAKVEVTLALNTPGSVSTSQSVVWGQ